MIKEEFGKLMEEPLLPQQTTVHGPDDESEEEVTFTRQTRVTDEGEPDFTPTSGHIEQYFPQTLVTDEGEPKMDPKKSKAFVTGSPKRDISELRHVPPPKSPGYAETQARLSQMIKEELGKLMEEFEPQSQIPAEFQAQESDLVHPDMDIQDLPVLRPAERAGLGALAGGLSGLAFRANEYSIDPTAPSGGGNMDPDSLRTGEHEVHTQDHPSITGRLSDGTALYSDPDSYENAMRRQYARSIGLGTGLVGSHPGLVRSAPLVGAAVGAGLGAAAPHIRQGVQDAWQAGVDRRQGRRADRMANPQTRRDLRRAREQGSAMQESRLNQIIREELGKLMEAVDSPPPDFPEEPESDSAPLPLETGSEFEEVPDVPDPETAPSPPPPQSDEVPPEEPSGFGESQDPFKRIRDLALKPYGSCKSEGEK